MSDAIYPKGYKAKPDNEKTDADWEIHEAITDWQQAAFNAHWYECSKFLDASKGGKQTSNDLHMLCQGYALAAARIQALKAALAEAGQEREATEGRFMAQVTALQIALGEARRQALEEAAKVAEGFLVEEPVEFADHVAQGMVEDIAQAIRALASDALLGQEGV